MASATEEPERIDRKHYVDPGLGDDDCRGGLSVNEEEGDPNSAHPDQVEVTEAPAVSVNEEEGDPNSAHPGQVEVAEASAVLGGHDPSKSCGEDKAPQRCSLKRVAFGVYHTAIVALLATLLCMPPLLSPLSDPALGFFGNPSFFIFYNSYVSCVCVAGALKRYSAMFVSSDGRMLGKNPFENIRVFMCRTLPLAISYASIVSYLSFMLTTAPWGDSVASSYNMIYTCPWMVTFLDFFPLFFLKRAEVKMGKIATFTSDASFYVGVPMFLTFGSATAASFLSHPIADVLAPGVNAGIIALVGRRSQQKLDGDLQAAELGVSYHESGLVTVFFATLNFSKMVMLPYTARATGIAAVLGLVGSDLGEMVLYLVLLRRSQRKAAAKPATSFKPGLSSCGKLIDKNLASLPPSFIAYLRAPLCRRAEQYVILVACPVMYVAAASVIVLRGNKHHYHLYECVDFDLLSYAFYLLALRTAALVPLFFVELLALKKMGLLSEALLMVEVMLKKETARTALCVANVGIIFTSCFYVKHDGIGIFSFFCREEV